jgi:ABC-type antimicrobial peptide transport system permease subunit
MQEHVAQSLFLERILATLAGAFGGLALVLAATGIYGMMAFQVARRRREIGIRMALGANARSMVGMVLGETARLTLLGCGIGAVGGLFLTRAAEGILHEIRPNDPLTFGAATLGLLLIALGAAYFPGHSAARTNPAETLRADQ